ncbi:ArsR/SmtB family transcription factor [Paraburkholderia susongensis]|uniref:Transcriptional regulator, ArsR family n=1 Tax=Paraburkholderia susongensis TaxID=1515439 RepID=A0A1X7LAJ8_9BURK|nr:helix-turn-helix domain-containing protein [Paraburkholderia susongensis]SMG50577.1 transcriptional regulator, ArsR family [Paraburkholderia susongensis]
MDVQPKVAATAFLIADAARAAMLMALADGRALPAGELAYAAGVTAQTASSHLAKLLDGGLLTVEKEGRHRYYRLADAQVASLLENLAAISARAPVRRKPYGRDARQLRFARCCYDHLAGQVGVTITQQLMQRDLLAAGEDKRFEVTRAGAQWFSELGIDVATLRPGKHGVARQCLDWTERQHHLAGPLGVRFMSTLCENGWLRRAPSSRVVQVTPLGWAALYEKLGVTADGLSGGSDGRDGEGTGR